MERSHVFDVVVLQASRLPLPVCVSAKAALKYPLEFSSVKDAYYYGTLQTIDSQHLLFGSQFQYIVICLENCIDVNFTERGG